MNVVFDQSDFPVYDKNIDKKEVIRTQAVGATNYLFDVDEVEEAMLATFVAKVALKNGLTTNDVMHLFPVILRILCSHSNWSGL